MAIMYEANPPKILQDTDKEKSISVFVKKIKTISKTCDAIHLTENVLGHQRISPIEIGRIIREKIPEHPITVSMRVRDKDEREILEFAEKCISIGFKGILVLFGDPSQTGKKDSGQVPSKVITMLKRHKIDSKIDLYLSVSNKPDFQKIKKKIAARPKGFMTQVVQNIEQVQTLSENLDGFEIIPIVLFPSEKNEGSAKFLNLDLAEYDQKFEELVRKTHDITGNVLITSPSDFNGLTEFLKEYQT